MAQETGDCSRAAAIAGATTADQPSRQAGRSARRSGASAGAKRPFAGKLRADVLPPPKTGERVMLGLNKGVLSTLERTPKSLLLGSLLAAHSA